MTRACLSVLTAIALTLGDALKQAIAGRKPTDLLDTSTTRALGNRRSLTGGEPPEVYVVTVPTILVVTEGAPLLSTVPGTALEYVTNTAAHIFKEPTDQELYVLTTNGWYRSWRTEGPWQSIATSDLPRDIARLPASQLTMAGGVE